jgi:hypothetical protein
MLMCVSCLCIPNSADALRGVSIPRLIEKKHSSSLSAGSRSIYLCAQSVFLMSRKKEDACACVG